MYQILIKTNYKPFHHFDSFSLSTQPEHYRYLSPRSTNKNKLLESKNIFWFSLSSCLIFESQQNFHKHLYIYTYIYIYIYFFH